MSVLASVSCSASKETEPFRVYLTLLPRWLYEEPVPSAMPTMLVLRSQTRVALPSFTPEKARASHARMGLSESLVSAQMAERTGSLTRVSLPAQVLVS